MKYGAVRLFLIPNLLAIPQLAAHPDRKPEKEVHKHWQKSVIEGTRSDFRSRLQHFRAESREDSRDSLTSMSNGDIFQYPLHDYLKLSATTLASKIRRLEITVEELLQVFIERIKSVNSSINAVVADRFIDALAEAREIDEMLREMTEDQRMNLKEVKPFLGVPFTAKESFALTGLPNSGGLVARKDLTATEDAVVVRRLRQAGAIPVGVSNCSELCMWWESANRVYGRTCNPFNKSKIVGGSSGGEGAVIGAAGSVFGVGSGRMCL